MDSSWFSAEGIFISGKGMGGGAQGMGEFESSWLSAEGILISGKENGERGESLTALGSPQKGS